MRAMKRFNFSSANLSGEQNRFFAARPNAAHASVMTESTTSKAIWESMKVEGFMEMEKRASAPKKPTKPLPAKICGEYKRPARVKQLTDHWKYDGPSAAALSQTGGDPDRVWEKGDYVPLKQKMRTDSTRGVDKFY